MKTNTLPLIASLVLGLSLTCAHAQKGMSDPSGISREIPRPETVSLHLVVLEVDIHPCPQTTGPAELGTHFFARGDQGKKLNIHLGPSDQVHEIAEQLKAGLELQAVVFRTEKMPTNHYVATRLEIGDKVLQLRDENARPLWAGKMKGNGRKGSRNGNRKRAGL